MKNMFASGKRTESLVQERELLFILYLLTLLKTIKPCTLLLFVYKIILVNNEKQPTIHDPITRTQAQESTLKDLYLSG